MKKIAISIFTLIFCVGCNNIDNNEKNISKTGDDERDQLRMTMGKSKIRDNILYIDGKEDKIPSREVRRFDSIREIIYSQYNSDVGYSKQKINKIIHTFRYDDASIKLVFLSKDRYSNDMKLYVDMLHYDKSQKKYSDVFNVEPPRKLEKDRPVFYDTDPAALKARWYMNIMKIPEEIEPNQYFGLTTRRESVKTLKIEGQKPDDIKEFSNNGVKYYFWYYDDLKTSKRPDKFKVTYKGKDKEYEDAEKLFK